MLNSGDVPHAEPVEAYGKFLMLSLSKHDIQGGPVEVSAGVVRGPGRVQDEART